MRVGLGSGLLDLVVDGVLDCLFDLDLPNLDLVGGFGEEDERGEDSANAQTLG